MFITDPLVTDLWILALCATVNGIRDRPGAPVLDDEVKAWARTEGRARA